ncbi:MAG: hypothetical protein IPJ64_13895 [Saprospiraceae bacterium]|nr:hypothetical protein [Saprospiraceae bacterium]
MRILHFRVDGTKDRISFFAPDSSPVRVHYTLPAIQGNVKYAFNSGYPESQSGIRYSILIVNQISYLLIRSLGIICILNLQSKNPTETKHNITLAISQLS